MTITTTSTKKYKILDPETGALDPRIYSDETIYREEMEKVFGRSWLLIGHESLVPNPGDFFHTYMGEEPVILTRDRQGGLNAMLNVCRHRGARLTRTDDGNCASFMCVYHGWTYGLDGALEYVPGEEQAYDNKLDKTKLGLRRARVETYAGLIFATWAPDAPSLEDFLGDARWYLDTEYKRRPAGFIAYGPQKWIQPVNWKTSVDNCSDWYHVPTTHSSASNALARVMGATRYTHEWNWTVPAKHAFVNGHQIAVFETTGHEAPAEEVERLGEFRANNVAASASSIFPNTVLGMRLAIPRGPLQTEFWHFALVPADATEEEKRVLRMEHASQNGAAGTFEADDIDNWRQVSNSGATFIGAQQEQLLNMGLGNAGPHDVYPGMVTDRFVSEHNQRAFYLRYQEFMNAGSWADISLEPQTAVYEGTTAEM
ncbi:aromatic ring-hydroxylating oxygenase subunit alpha [Streptomyces fuscichromogenes]|uniref:3-phenylpropionate/cinnamic acid dioxygenase subunit alpha n=1 Tax=Streptomyces fuscichromogenes TaxID=1324013 RepID=A0A918CWL7_9ACTN|nr:aromatic ring-hydroxylating dioxygenase subunit alpha [Streptomyces fuscichromogenes]GGN40261.1 3-phenylpropionate/cinnamic acid dioxygenase subunit alpha [Streptomyces fuscichromogenes]